MYISRDARGRDDPLTSLRDFRRLALPPGGSAAVEFVLPAAAFESVNDDGDPVLIAGSYTVTAADAAPLPVSLERGASRPVRAKIEIRP